MTKINLKGQVIKPSEMKDCRGVGCPIPLCKIKKRSSHNECLGYYDEMDCFGTKHRMWRCEYFKD